MLSVTRVDWRIVRRLIGGFARDLIIIVTAVYLAHIVLQGRLYFGRLLPLSTKVIFMFLFFITAYVVIELNAEPYLRVARLLVLFLLVGFLLYYVHRPLLKADTPTLLQSVNRYNIFDYKTAGRTLNLLVEDQAVPQVPNSFDFWNAQLIVNDPAAERVVFLNREGTFISSLDLTFRATRIDRLDDQLLLQRYGSSSDADVICRLTTRKCIDMTEAPRDQKSELRRERDAIVDAKIGDVTWVRISPGIGGLRSLGNDSRGNQFVLVERQSPGQKSVERIVRIYSPEHRLIDELSDVAPQSFLYVDDDLRVDGNYLYQLFVSDNGVELKRWRIL